MSLSEALDIQDESCTCLEINIATPIVPGVMYDTVIKQVNFFKLLQKAKAHYPMFQKQCKRYAHGDYEYLHYDGQEKFTVNKRRLIKFHGFNDFVVSHLKKESAMPFMFPWSNKLHDTEYISRATFKISNRLFLNFESRYAKPDATPTYHVYFNYNHGHNVETAMLSNNVQTALTHLGYSLIPH